MLLINSILGKISDGNVLLKDVMSINSGVDITISKIRKRHSDNFGNRFNIGDGVFVLTDDEFNGIGFDDDDLDIIKPLIKNSDISKYHIDEPTKHLIYTNGDTNIDDYPSVKKHLSEYKVILKDQMKRYNEPVSNWFMLHRPRDEKIFTSEKIVLPYRSKVNSFAYTDSPVYGSRDVFFLLKKDNDFDIKYILALLNSKLYYVWLYYRGKRKGDVLEMFATPLGKIPVKFVSVSEQRVFVDLVDKLILLKDELCCCNVPNLSGSLELQVKGVMDRLDLMVYELFGLSQVEIDFVESLF